MPRAPIDYQNAGALIRLGDGRDVLVGRGSESLDGFDLQTIRHRGLDERHVAILRGGTRSFWLIDLAADRSCVFCDGSRATRAELVDGGVVQVGPLAWRLNQAKEVMTPVAPIEGFDLTVDAEVEGRLTRTRLRIRRGEMTALVGPSGCGKSTLLETIRDGSGLVGQVETAGRVFFVPQRDLVHQDLMLGDALRSIGRLYQREVLPFEIDAALDSVGLPPTAKTKFPGELSGGQLRRFRIAGAVLSGAGVIVLDEPDSGLDHETADEVIALLQSLAVRGATIVAVTHHRHALERFDRIVTMRMTPEGGAVEAIGPVVVDDASTLEPETHNQHDAHDEPIESAVATFGRFPILLRREQQKLTSPRLTWFSWGGSRVPHFVIGLLLVPLLFALAVAISVPTDPDRDVQDGLYGQMAPIVRLGFLSIVSVVWMSASGSHLSIARDRELYDYERSHGLTWAGMLSAKSVVLSIAGVMQTGVFVGFMVLIRDVWLSRSFFVDQRSTQLAGVVVCLFFVSIAATMLGLLISSVAGRTPLVATAILPVVMMFQILFSAPFAVSNTDGYEPLADYDQLTVFAVDVESEADPWEGDAMEDEKPLWATSLFSYGTLSRYGDKWIRSFAVTTEPPDQAASVQWASAAALALISGLCFVGAWFVIWLQSTRLGVRRAVAVAVVLATMSVVGPDVAVGQGARDPEAESSLTIRLPLVDGRYDENQFRRELGGRVEPSPRWRTLGNQDRIGLVALELIGKIEFTLNEHELAITLNETSNWDLVKQLAPPRLIGAEDAVGARDVVLLVHGLEGGGSTFALAAEELERREIAAMRFDYPNDGPPEEIGRRLAQQLTQFGRGSPGTRIHVVAHSLGGLVATWAVTEDGFPDGLVSHVVTLGTPYRGSQLASFHDELELLDVVYRLASGSPDAFNTIQDGRGEAAAALDPGSAFLDRLGRRARPRAIRFHLGAGTKSFLTDARRTRLVAELPEELSRLGVAESYAARLDRLLGSEELRDGRGDGAVTLVSALGLTNPASSKTFPLTHTGLVSDLAPLEWALGVTGLADPAKPRAK